MSLTPEQLQAISQQQDQNSQLPGQGVESPQLMAARGAAANPSFLRFLVEIMRQGSLNPNPQGFSMDLRGSQQSPTMNFEENLRRRGRQLD